MAMLAAIAPMLASAMPYVTAGAAVAGGLAKSGQDQQAAAILHANANAAQASSQRSAMGVTLQTQLRQGRLRALAAAGGGSATDPTVQDLSSQVGTEGEYRRLSALYAGNATAQGDVLRADMLERQSGADAASGLISGATSLFSQKSAFYNKYSGYSPLDQPVYG